MAYELWETKSGNIIDTYTTEAAALAEVRATVAECGREAVDTYALARETSRGTTLIAQGDALAERALATTLPAEPEPQRASSPAHLA